mmetsp:Transcript_55025/g.170467  ORF Transcript_55025/g.170467 Transcript_55025/m.170467 type:complete len:324 (+) Transcript_55025:975-1946(+)
MHRHMAEELLEEVYGDALIAGALLLLLSHYVHESVLHTSRGEAEALAFPSRDTLQDAVRVPDQLAEVHLPYGRPATHDLVEGFREASLLEPCLPALQAELGGVLAQVHLAAVALGHEARRPGGLRPRRQRCLVLLRASVARLVPLAVQDPVSPHNRGVRRAPGRRRGKRRLRWGLLRERRANHGRRRRLKGLWRPGSLVEGRQSPGAAAGGRGAFRERPVRAARGGKADAGVGAAAACEPRSQVAVAPRVDGVQLPGPLATGRAQRGRVASRAWRVRGCELLRLLLQLAAQGRDPRQEAVRWGRVLLGRLIAHRGVSRRCQWP